MLLEHLVAKMVGFVAGLLLSVSVYGRAGGGGTGGGGAGGSGAGGGYGYYGRGGSGGYVTWVIGDGSWAAWVLGSIVLAIVGFKVCRGFRMRIKKAKTRTLMRHLMRMDPAWNEARIKQHVTASFMEIQEAWCVRDLERLQALLSRRLFKEWNRRIQKAKKQGEHDVMWGTRILRREIVDVRDYADNDKDQFTVKIVAFANDQTVNDAGKVKDVRPCLFVEFWTYRRNGDDWLLHEVAQECEEAQYMKPNYVEKEA
jgi:hypothetical protein